MKKWRVVVCEEKHTWGCSIIGGESKVTEYRFNFELEPQQQERPRATRRGNFIRMYDPPKTARFKNDLKQLAKLKMAGKDKLEGPLKVDLTFGRAVQKSISENPGISVVVKDCL